MDGHEHDHEHDEHEHDEHEHAELDEAARAEAETDLARLAGAAAALDDDALRQGLGGMSEKSRAEVADVLHLPRATMHLGSALVPLVRRKLRGASHDRRLQVAFALTEQVNEATVAALGDRAEDPSRDDVLSVLPPVIDAHGLPLVTLMLAGYAASDARCRPVMRALLDDDERFTIGPPIVLEEPAGARAPELARPADDAAAVAKREQRRASKEAKRAAAAHARAARSTAEAKRRAAAHQAKRKGR
jgi:hypothetical protein